MPRMLVWLVITVGSTSGCLAKNEDYLGPAETGTQGDADTGAPGGSCVPDPQAGTVLAQAAAQMAPGTWEELITMGFTSELLSTGGGWIGEQSNAGVWDPVSRRALFVGLDFIAYEEESNAWSRAGGDPYDCSCLEGADHTTIDPATGTMYHRGFGAPDVFSLQDTAGWTPLPEIPSEIVECCNGLEYFPPRDELVFVDGGGVHTLRDDAWTHAIGSLDLPDRNIVEYSPPHELLLFAGGRRLLLYGRDGNAEPQSEPPIDIDVRTTVITPDLVTGNFIVLADPQSMFEYDPITDEWLEIAGTAPPFEAAYNGIAGSFVAVPVTSYCLTIFMAYRFDESKVLLYRHG